MARETFTLGRINSALDSARARRVSSYDYRFNINTMDPRLHRRAEAEKGPSDLVSGQLTSKFHLPRLLVDNDAPINGETTILPCRHFYVKRKKNDYFHNSYLFDKNIVSSMTNFVKSKETFCV